MSTNDFIYDIGDHIDIGLFHAKIIKKWNDKKTGIKMYDYLCDKCGCINQKSEYLIKKGSGCPVCANRIVVSGINDIPTTDPWMIDYFPGGIEQASHYSSNMKKEFIPQCPFCKRLRDRPLSPNAIFTRHGMSCICKDGISMPNKFIYGLMEELLTLKQIKMFKREYPIIDQNGTKRLFDVYCEIEDGERLLIEMDGGYNHPDIIKKHKTGEFVAISSKFIYAEMMKENISIKLGLPVVHIDCYKSDFEYIKNNVLCSKLSVLFDLSHINWNRILELCYGNIIKNVCDYKKQNPEKFSSDVGKIFGLSGCTVTKYWKYGKELGWCDYDSSEELHRSNTRYRKSITDRPIEVYNLKNNKLYNYECTAEFIRKSEEDLGLIITKKKCDQLFKKYNNQIIIDETYRITKLKSKKEDFQNGICKS